MRKWALFRWHVEFKSKIPRHSMAMGICDHRSQTITLNRTLWPRASEAQRNETIIHEVAHAIAGIPGAFESPSGHGPLWKRQMQKMGISNVVAHHTVVTAGVAGGKNHISVCCCGFEGDITLRKAHKFFSTNGRCKCRGGSDKMRFFDEASRKKYLRYVASLGYGRGLRYNPIRICATE